MTKPKESSGVEELIGRLREQGVEEGKAQADALMEQTRLKAERHLDEAKREADGLLQRARENAEKSKRAGEEAVQLAVRDAILSLKSEMVDQFSDRVRRLASRELNDGVFLKQLILEIGGRSAPTRDQSAKLLLPKDAIGLEQLRSDPEEVKEGNLSHFVASITKEMLRDGLELGTREDTSAGIRIQLLDENVEIELTDEAIAELLLRHLVPRFRAIMEGIIQ
ncbi:V-type ATP synthase subunit E [Stieleria magnilauensis]|uniref:V-type ATP synthase subunit E n=1 Tax=Stieleria magnilauensis TaxID=2527963 RepID=A0ABX5XP00_9BACT|nr:V-type ATP synthase subunit E [Planctomycetes bacterium TBK1r]